MMSKKSLPVLIVVLIGGILGAVSCKGRVNQDDTLARQQQLLSAIGMIMEQYHYSPKAIDDNFSQKIFTNYIKQLDGEKDIFLRIDIDSLGGYKNILDDEIKGTEPMLFFPTALDIFKRRIQQLSGIYQKILSTPFDFTQNESIQLNGDSLDYPASENERIDRWRKRLKYQTLVRYVNLQNQREKAKAGDSIKLKSDAQLEKEARAAVLKMVNRSFNRYDKTTNETEQFNQYVNVITQLMDPHTEYQAPLDKREFDEQMSNKFYGIGALLRNNDGVISVESLVTGSPAWKSGKIHPNDIIEKVAEKGKPAVDISGFEITDAVKLIRGNKGTEVYLTIKKALDGTSEEVMLVRDEIKQEEGNARSAVITKNGKKLGYIWLPEFYDDFNNPNGAKCAVDVANEIKKLKQENIQGLVMDLRNNGGGSLYDVVQMVGLFVKDGPIVQVRDRKEKVEELKDTDTGILYTGPLTVMVNEFSASASEIFAAAIQDYGRGVIIGSDTYGKGTVQKQMPLGKPDQYGMPEFGALKLTFEKFYRINGGSTQMKGVVPDVKLPDSYEFLKIRERDNPSALPWDKIAPAIFTPWSENYHIAEISAAATARINSSTAFNTIKSNTNWLEKNSDLPVDLNIVKYKAVQEIMKQMGTRNDSLTKMKIPLSIVPAAANYNVFYKNADADKGKRFQQWLKYLQTDIYINESVTVLNEMLGTEKPKAVARKK